MARPSGDTAAQALVGGANYHKLVFERAEVGMPSNTVEADLSTMPVLGMAGHYELAGGDGVEVGLDGGALVSWASDQGAAFSPGQGSAVVLVDRRLVVTDLFFGFSVSAVFDDQLRLYAGAGPNAVIVNAEYRDELRSASDTGIGFGGYIRGGAEFRLEDGAFLGLGARWVASEVDLDDPIGEVDIEGWQFFVSYSLGF